VSDIDRSMRRAVARALGAEWEVGAGEEGTWARPYARVASSTPISVTPHGARHRDMTQGYAIAAFPTSFPITPAASMNEARRVEALLLDCFTAGVEAEHFRNGRRHPNRVPIYSYEGVPEGEAATDLIGWIRVLATPSIGSITDPDDEAQIVVVADVRIGWSEGIAVPTGPPVQIVGIEPGP
jgi:hypothetical protein